MVASAAVASGLTASGQLLGRFQTIRMAPWLRIRERQSVVVQGATDGAIARYYTRHEWREMVRGLFKVESLQVYGLKNSIVPLPHGRFKQILEDIVPDSIARILTHHLRGGVFLVAQMRTL